MATIGVLLRAISAMRGFRISPMDTRTPTAIRTSATMLGLFGLFNYLTIYPFKIIA